ncbi:MAG TPA: transketolase [Micropepsaceae bacterium]
MGEKPTSALRTMANSIRALAMDAVEAAKSGHPGMPMGMADAASVLFTRFLKFDASDPAWPDRDRFVLSAGHGSMLLYALLYLTGYPGISMTDIKRFRQFGSVCAGHPEHGEIPGIEMTTGPLGQGLATAVGMALAERILNARFGDAIVDHKTYVIASDGDLMEGISHEACSIAGHLKLNRLIVLYDDNHITIDGSTALSDSTDALMRFEAMGWAVSRVDGMDGDAVAAALEAAQSSDRPVLIACRTIIGYGAPKRAGTSKAHGEALGAEEIAGARAALGWPYPPFEIPPDLLSVWRTAGARGSESRKAWESRLSASPAASRAAFEAALSGDIPPQFAPAIAALKAKFTNEKPAIATRKSSELVLEEVNANIPSVIGGAADLTPSTLTKTKNDPEISPGNYAGRYIHYGIREHGMAAAMSGMALHGGIIPYSGTFFVFSDYCRPAIRLAALMKQRVIHVMTHDSIGLGEDGPTHQPVEHLAALRAMPNLLVLRPADAVETAEIWEIALTEKTRPSVLALSRQNLATLRDQHTEENLSRRGAYVLRESDGPAKVTILATGSEVEIAVAARDILQAQRIGARVVSMPCWELFEEQDPAYRAKVLDSSTVKVAIEAASSFGWSRYIGGSGAFVGIDHFGASAPYKELYKAFGITAERAAEAAVALLKGN